MKKFGWTKVKGRPLSMIIRSASPCWRPKVNEAAGCAPMAENFTGWASFAFLARSTRRVSTGERRIERVRLIEVGDDDVRPGPLEVRRTGRILDHGANGNASRPQRLDNEAPIGSCGSRNENHDGLL